MITISANGNRPAYGIKEYTLDTKEDLTKLTTRSATPGSKAFVIETSKYYMLNGKKEWVEIKPYGNSIFDGDEDEEIIYDGGSVAEDDSSENIKDEIIYEGGAL